MDSEGKGFVPEEEKKVHLGKIKPMRVPELEKFEKEFDDFIENSAELQKRIDAVESNPSLSIEGFEEIIRLWNSKHPEKLSGLMVQREFKGANFTLYIIMDSNRNVKLSKYLDRASLSTL